MSKNLSVGKKRISLFILILMIGVFLSACSSNGQHPQSGNQMTGEQSANNKDDFKKVTIVRNFKTDTLDPFISWEPLRAGIVETLTRLDERMQIQPWLASKWETKDAKTWVFTIRDGITFHDGMKLDAEAVKASIEEGLATSKSLAVSLKIASMQAVGQELTIVTSEPYPALPSELVNPYIAIINAEAKKKAGAEAFNLAPVGTGPFSVKRFTPNVEILLERNDAYWDGKAKLNEVSFKFNEDANVRALALQSHEADIAYQLPAETIAALQQDKELGIESIPGLRVHLLIFNQQKPVMTDVRVRKALDLLLDRESIVKDIMLGNGTAANGPFNTILPFGSDDKVEPLNIAQAKMLLEAAGYEAGTDGKLYKGGQPLTLELITYKGRPELPLIAQLFQSDAAKAGITVKVTTVEKADAYLHENKNWDLTTYSILSAPRGDGGYFLNSALTQGGSLNMAGISIEGLDNLLSPLNTTSDIAQRVVLTKEALKIIKEEVPHAYAVYPNLIVGVNKRIVGWKPGPEEYYKVTNKMDVK